MTARRDIPYNSVISYHELHDLEDRQAAVLQIVAECPGVSSAEVFRILRQRGHKVQMNSVTPRLTELIGQGRIRITGKKTNRLTGRPVRMYEIVAGSMHEVQEGSGPPDRSFRGVPCLK